MANDKKTIGIFLGVMTIPVIWFGILIAPFIGKGLLSSLPEMSEAINHPFKIQFTNNTLKTVLVVLLLYRKM